MSVVKKVINDRILIKPSEEDPMTDGGLYKPDTQTENAKKGTIVEIGEGKYIDGKLRELSVAVGDEVLYEGYAGKEVKIDSEQYVVVREAEIMLILNKNEK